MNRKTNEFQERFRNLQGSPDDIIVNDLNFEPPQSYTCLCHRTFWSLSCVATHLRTSECSQHHQTQCDTEIPSETKIKTETEIKTEPSTPDIILTVPPRKLVPTPLKTPTPPSTNRAKRSESNTPANINFIEIKPNGERSFSSCVVPKRNEPNAIECIFCEHWSIRPSNFRTHLKKIHNYEPHKVIRSNIHMQSVSIYCLDGLIDDSNFTNTIECDICKRNFESRLEYKSHLLVMHSLIARPTDVSTCDQLKRMVIDIHVEWLEKGGQPIVCLNCAESFDYYGNYNQHIYQSEECRENPDRLNMQIIYKEKESNKTQPINLASAYIDNPNHSLTLVGNSNRLKYEASKKTQEDKVVLKPEPLKDFETVYISDEHEIVTQESRSPHIKLPLPHIKKFVSNPSPNRKLSEAEIERLLMRSYEHNADFLPKAEMERLVLTIGKPEHFIINWFERRSRALMKISSSDARKMLLESFQQNPVLTANERYRLAKVSGKSEKFIAQWFRNKRCSDNRERRKMAKDEEDVIVLDCE